MDQVDQVDRRSRRPHSHGARKVVVWQVKDGLAGEELVPAARLSCEHVQARGQFPLLPIKSPETGHVPKV